MQIPTEPIGSIPRPAYLVESMQAFAEGRASSDQLAGAADQALRDTIRKFEETESPIITDGEQTKPSFATYPIHGLPNFAPDGVVIPFADGHTRQLPRLKTGPFRYATYASSYLHTAQQFTDRPLKQAVISASALSLLYPQKEIPSYSREQFLSDLIAEAEADIRGCLESGAASVQVDFTEGRLAVKLDPSLKLLQQFIELNNRVIERFPEQDRLKIGVHTCPGGDRDSTHSADADYSKLLPSLFTLRAGSFYVQMASEADRRSVLQVIREHLGPQQRVFVGVIDPINPHLETPEEVYLRVLEAAEFIPLSQLGVTDDCGFSPFSDDASTSRELAFKKIRARVLGTRMAAERLGV